MKNKQGGFIVLVAWIVVALVLAGGGFYIYKEETSKTTMIDNTQEDEIKLDEKLQIEKEEVLNNESDTEVKTNTRTIAPIVKEKSKNITVTIPASIVWKENNTYSVNWTNTLPPDSYDYYLVQIGHGTSTKWVSTNPGSYGLWKIEKNINRKDIKFNILQIEEQLNYSKEKFDLFKDSFFIRVSVYGHKNITDPHAISPRTEILLSSADSAFFSVQSPYDLNNPIRMDENKAAANAAIRASVMQIMPIAALIYDDEGNSFTNLCKNNIINHGASANTDISKNLSLIIDTIVKAQGVTSQSEASTTCLSLKEKYAIEVIFTEKSISGNRSSFCIDSSGQSGDNNRLKLNKATVSCEIQ